MLNIRAERARAAKELKLREEANKPKDVFAHASKTNKAQLETPPSSPKKPEPEVKPKTRKTDSGISVKVVKPWLSCMVQGCEQERDGEWTYTLELVHRNEQTELVFRSYDQVWDLHLFLFDSLRKEAGLMGYPRLLPFLDPPLENMHHSEAQRRCQVLNQYLNSLLAIPIVWHTRSLEPLLNSREGDRLVKSSFAATDLLMDLLDLNTSQSTTILIHKEQTLRFQEPPTLSTLLKASRDRFGSASGILYKNEWGVKCLLRSDNELRLLSQVRDTIRLYTV